MFANLANSGTQVITGNDSIVIKTNLESLEGGKTLDVTGFAPKVINAGHVIIRETSTGNLKPMPISGTTYAALPASHTYFGILVASIATDKPFAAILIRGTVNHKATAYTMDTILADVKAALPHILFRED